MHLTKDAQRRAIYRAPGSIGFVGAARVVLAAAKDPNDEARRLLVPVKANLSAPPAALAFSLASGRLEWEPGHVEGVDADTLLCATGSAEDRDERRNADELLLKLLVGSEAKATEVFRAARENGISERTLYRAKRRLGIKARHEGQPGRGGGAWYWSLPEGCHTKTAIDREVAAFGEHSDGMDETARTSSKAATRPTVAAFGGSGGSVPANGEGEEVNLWPES
jgi:hypothetical protein